MKSVKEDRKGQPVSAGVKDGLSSHQKIEGKDGPKTTDNGRQTRKKGKSGWDCY